MTKIPSDRRQGAPNRLVLDLDDLPPPEAAELDGWVDSLREPLPPDEPLANPVRNRVPFFGRRPVGRGARFRAGWRQP